jgi:hypothetical protein
MKTQDKIEDRIKQLEEEITKYRYDCIYTKNCQLEIEALKWVLS